MDGRRRITPEQALEIKAKWGTGEYTKAALACAYGVSRRCVQHVLAPDHEETDLEWARRVGGRAQEIIERQHAELSRK